jgi:hypothetical protein
MEYHNELSWDAPVLGRRRWQAQGSSSNCRSARERSRGSFVFAAWLLVLMSLGNLFADENQSPRTLLVFSAMGDVPYTPLEYVLLPQQIADLPTESAFVVHLGDIKTGQVPCNETIYETVAGILAKSKPRLFIIPGDNEWNDCANPADGWTLWQKYFRRFDEKWKPEFAVHRQVERDENFSFVISEVLFIGLNIVGGRVHDAEEWKQRHGQNLAWTQQNLERHGATVRAAVIFGHALPVKVHDDYFNGLCDAAIKFDKPMLYLHGDGHKWIHDYPFAAKNILRIQVDQGGIAPPIKVTVTDDAKNPFVVDRRKK